MLYNGEYSNPTNPRWKFSSQEWIGISSAGLVAAAISFAANSCVLIVHGFMSWYRPVIVNRLSLRMIVASCICNMLYCASQLVTDRISSLSYSCRALAYVTTVSDTMACMCLAMVGLNLVMIFVLKTSRSIKIEILYYMIVALSGVIVSVVPMTIGTSKGPKNKRIETSCWYHYYFEGRMFNIFNWMWYYGCLLFSLVFAALCAAISIRFVVKRQANFTGALDMFSKRDKKDISAMAIIRKYSNRNTDVFRKIARRCVCYPLVPLFSKSWGVGIEIAASQDNQIPYIIFVLDRLFSCLLGFMVSCIYFTDPAINAIFREGIEYLKHQYVYNYYCVRYCSTATQQLPATVKIASLSYDLNTTPEFVKEAHHRFFSQDSQENSKVPETPLMKLQIVHGEPILDAPLHEKRYSIISATTKDGHQFLPNQPVEDNRSLTKSKFTSVPMRSMNDAFILSHSKTVKHEDVFQHHGHTKQVESIETLEPFKYPFLAKLMHWLLVHVFRVKPLEKATSKDKSESVKRNTQPDVFSDPINKSSHFQGSPLTSFDKQEKSVSPPSLFSADFDLTPQQRSLSKSPASLRRTTSVTADQPLVTHPLRRTSSVNMASLHLQHTRLSSDPSLESPGLPHKKIIHPGRSLSFSWSKISKQTSTTSSLFHTDHEDLVSKDSGSIQQDQSTLQDTMQEQYKSRESALNPPTEAFPVQLSPRPRSQYKPLSLKPLRGSAKRDKSSQPKKTISDSLNDSCEHLETEDSVTFPQPVYHPLRLNTTQASQQDPLQDHMAINLISHWQDDPDRDIDMSEEIWDLQDQIMKQIGFARDINHI